MKGILRNMWLVVMAVAAMATGCSKEDPEVIVPTPEITITNVKATLSSVTFTLTAKDAAKYTYTVALKGTTGTAVTVEGKLTSTETVTGLEADKEYVITALAFSPDGALKSKEETHEFMTNPKAKIAISEQIETTSTTAVLTLTPTNATEMSYTYYKKADGKPADPTWMKIMGNNPEIIMITGLASDTEYQVEAYAKNEEGDGDPLTATFKTGGVFSLKFAATKSTVAAFIDFDTDKCQGYVASMGLVNLNDEWAQYKDVAGFLEVMKRNLAYGMEATTEPGWINLGSGWGAEDNTYAYFTVQVTIKVEGDKKVLTLLDETAKAWSVTQPATNTIGGGAATVALSEVKAGSLSIEAKAKFSPNSIMYVAAAVTKSQAASGLEGYLTGQMESGMVPVELVSSLEGGKLSFVNMIRPATPYIIAVIAVDMNGKFSSIVSQEVTTSAVDYDQNVTVKAEIDKIMFSRVSFKVTMTGTTNVRQTILRDEFYEEAFDRDVNAALVGNLFSEWSETMTLDENGIWTASHGLDAKTKYWLLALPVKDDGSYGQWILQEFETLGYDGSGTASVTLTKGDSKEEWGTPVIDYTITPGEGCTDYMYVVMMESIYKLNSKKLGRWMAEENPSNCTYVSPAKEVSIDFSLYEEGAYLMVMARDAAGKWSAPIVSDMFEYQPVNGKWDITEINTGSEWTPVVLEEGEAMFAEFKTSNGYNSQIGTAVYTGSWSKKSDVVTCTGVANPGPQSYKILSMVNEDGVFKAEFEVTDSEKTYKIRATRK